jgi:hypothetical protein
MPVTIEDQASIGDVMSDRQWVNSDGVIFKTIEPDPIREIRMYLQLIAELLVVQHPFRPEVHFEGGAYRITWHGLPDNVRVHGADEGQPTIS